MGIPLIAYPIASALLGFGAAKMNEAAAEKERKRVEALQEARAKQEFEASMRKADAQMEAARRADSIRDQEYRIRDDQQKDFAGKLQEFGMANKAKKLKEKQGERIKGQSKVVEQAKSDGKLRAGSNVKGKVSGTFTKGSSAGTGQVVDRATEIGQLMGRLSGTKADFMREGGILGDMNAQGTALQSRIAGIKADSDRERRIGELMAIRAGSLPEAQEIVYDPSSTWGKRLGIASQLVGLAGMGAGAGLFGNGASSLMTGGSIASMPGAASGVMSGGAMGSSSLLGPNIASSGANMFSGAGAGYPAMTPNLYNTFGM